jgi:predicted dehydrogenase
MTRRRFLKAGAALPLMLRSSALGAPATTEHVSASRRVNLACIGVGWQGTNNLLSFLDEPAAQVVAVCDIDANHLENARALVNQKYGNQDCRTYHNFEDVLARNDIDAVMLAVPDHWHGLLSVAAARAGKDIYGEKPLAHNFAEGQAIVEAVDRYQTVWQSGSWQRSLAPFRFACELVRNGRIGKVRTAEVGLPGGLTDFDGLGDQDRPVPVPRTLDYDRWLGPAPVAPYSPARVHKTWRWNLDYGGGMLMDWVGHHVDVANWGLRLEETGPVEVEATGEYSNVNRVWDAPALFRVTARYQQGVTLKISGGYNGVRSGVKFIGDDGWVWIDRAGIEAQPRSLLSSVIRQDEIRLERSPGHWRNFLECVLDRRKTIAPVGAALRAATPGYLGLISILTGSKVKWDPVAQRIIDNVHAERLLSRPMRSPWRIGV